MQNIQEYLDENQGRFISELIDYARFPSVSALSQHKTHLHSCAKWIKQHCQEIGLRTRLFTTEGNPILVARTPAKTGKKGNKRPQFLVYGHYDVQPAEPFELWKTPPFEPTLEDHALYGRGVSDNKGQHMAHIKAVEAYLKTGTPLPCDITFLIEGEEEVGSRNLTAFLKANRKELACDAIVISDNGIPSLKHPALTYSLRGITAMELTLHGPNRDLHSGIYGGCVENPAMALSKVLAQLRDDQGRITVPGFYEDVVDLNEYERNQLARLPENDALLRRFLGVPKLFGEEGYSPLEQRSARPTLEINGLTSGYQGEGSKTIIPAWARAKLTMRLVPDQDPKKINRLVKDHLHRICPPTVRMDLETGHGGEPYFVSPELPLSQAALRALEKAFHRTPYLMREGGSIPIVNRFKKVLRAETLLLGLALPDDNAHSPNEKFSMDSYRMGMWMGANLWPELSSAME